MKTRTFVVQLEASPEALRDTDIAVDAERILREETAATEFRGPRGGRYVPIGAPYAFRSSRDHDQSFIRDVILFTARVDARYVRP